MTPVQRAVLTTAILLSARPVSAQTTGRWEIEVVVGGTIGSSPTGGTDALPGPGAAFTTIAGTPSRKVSSWYFGDGALLLNQVLQGLGRGERLTPLDPALTTATLHWRSGAALGARVRRHLDSRLSAEWSLQYGLGRLAITGAGREAIEASRTSFVPAWTGLFATGPFLSPAITSTATFTSGGREILTTGAINVALTPRGRLRPYLTGGAGLRSNVGDPPKVALAGEYRVLFGGVAPIAERDSIVLRYDVPGTVFIGVGGGGISYAVSPTWGVRADVRVHAGRNGVDSLVDAMPFIETVASPQLVVSSPTSPSIQFRNFPQPGAGTGSAQPTFGGPPIAGSRTFAGRGARSQVDVTVGVFRRF